MVIKDERVKSIPEDGVKLNEIVHACVVVRDVEETARRISERLGIGPFEVRQKSYPESHASVRGEPVAYTLKFAYARVGPITLELVETVEGRTIYQEFLEEHGEGIHHLGFPTPLPFEMELEKWGRLGIEPLQVSRLDDPEEGWAYMDTQGFAGFIVEILSFRKYQ